MKAIFAVSALAAAISAQAIAADTEATTTFTGEVNVGSTFDLLTEDRYHTLTTEGDDGYFLDMNVDVVNGGFTGSMAFESDDTGAVSASIGDLTYTEGAIMFGDVDTIITTETSVDDMSENTAYGVDKGFRYTSDFGLTVQAEVGSTDYDADLDGDVDDDDEDVAGYAALGTDFGIAAAYMADLDVATVTADVQYREADVTTTESNDALALYAGLKAVAMPMDMLTVTAGYTMGHSIAAADFYDADTTVTSYGVRADVAVMEGVTAYGYYSQVDDADANLEVGATATFAPLTVSASQHMQGDVSTTDVEATVSQDFEVADGVTVNAHAGATWETDTDMDWTAGADVTYMFTDMLSAYAGYEIDTAGDGSQLTAGLAYTTEGGASLTADYTNQNDVYDDADGEVHEVALKAAYSF